MGLFHNKIQKKYIGRDYPPESRPIYFIQFFLVQALIILLVLIILASANPSLYYPGRDSGIFLYIGKSILDGNLPYLDTWENKGPLIFYINALGLLIGGGGRWGVWLVEFVFLFIAINVGRSLLRRMFGVFPSAVGIIIWFLALRLVFQGGNYTEDYSLVFSFIALLIFWFSIQKERQFYFYLIIGFTLGINFILRPNNVGAQVSIIITLFLLASLERNWNVFFRQLGWILFGVILTLLPVVIYFHLRGVLTELIQAVFVFNFQYSSNLNIRILLRGLKIGFLNFGFWLSLIAGIGYLWMLFNYLYRIDKLSGMGKFQLLLLIYWPIEGFLSILSGRNYPHYFITWTPVISIFGSYLFNIFLSIFNLRLIKYKNGILAIFVLLTLIFGFNSLSSYSIPLYKILSGDSPKSTEIVHPVAEYVHEYTSVGEPIFIWGFRPYLYYVTDRKSPNIYLPYPIMHVETPESHMLAEQSYSQLIAKKPILIVDMVDPALDPIPSIDPVIRETQERDLRGVVIAHNILNFYDWISINYEPSDVVDGYQVYKLRSKNKQ